MTDAAGPPGSAARQDTIFPCRIRSVIWANSASREDVTGRPCASRSGSSTTTGWPGCFSSEEMISPVFPAVTAKETSVGGTSRFSKVPDMESFPPIAAAPRFIWASNAPSRAARGLPQRFPSVPGFSKYSWKVRYTSS